MVVRGDGAPHRLIASLWHRRRRLTHPIPSSRSRSEDCCSPARERHEAVRTFDLFVSEGYESHTYESGRRKIRRGRGAHTERSVMLCSAASPTRAAARSSAHRVLTRGYRPRHVHRGAVPTPRDRVPREPDSPEGCRLVEAGPSSRWRAPRRHERASFTRRAARPR